MIILLIKTKDEADLLKLNLEHHLNWGVDHIGVCDNVSTDHTQEVIKSFGGYATSLVFKNFHSRGQHQTRCLEMIREKVGKLDWVGVSDTDEFWWSSESLRDLLAEVPREVKVASSHQKLFIPTEIDPPIELCYHRMLYRVIKHGTFYLPESWDHKAFCRGSWLRKVTCDHTGRRPRQLWFFKKPFVHHYAVRSEDHFVQKMKCFTPIWQHRNKKGEKPGVDYKKEALQVFQKREEVNLRVYYKDHYLVTKSKLKIALEAGHLTLDRAFSDYMRSK